MDTSTRGGNCALLSTSVLVMMAASISALCPSRCTCDDSTLAVDCKDASLDLVPITLNPSLSELYLNRNAIKSIASSFTFYRKLQLLDMSENGISSLGSHNFHSQSILQVLLINSNKVTHLKRDTFAGLSALTILSLAGNHIDSVEEHAFSGLKSLEKLDLARNHLKTLQRHSLFGLSNLKVLHLQQNMLKVLPNDALHSVKSLSHLDVSFNLIDSSSVNIASLDHLTHLNLEGNKMSQIDNSTFANVRATLSLLNLASNLLETVPTDGLSILNNLQHLIVSGNAISELSANALFGLHKLQSFTLTNDDSLKSIHRNAFSSNTLLHSVSIDFCRNLHFVPVETFILQREILRSVSLRENGLTQLPVELLDWNSIQSLDIRGNPFNCSCDIVSLSKVINKQVNVSIEGEHLKEILCQEPMAVRGRQVSSITAEEMKCVTKVPPRENTFGTSYSFFSSSSLDANNRTSLSANGQGNWLSSTAVPTRHTTRTSRFLVLPVSIALAISLALAIALAAFLLVRRMRQRTLADKRIKHFLTVNINNLQPANHLSGSGISGSNCNSLLLNKNYSSARDNSAKDYSSMSRSGQQSHRSHRASFSPGGEIVNPFESVNLYESPIYHEISGVEHCSPSRKKQSVPLISSSPFTCTTYIDTCHDESSRKSRTSGHSSRNSCSSPCSGQNGATSRATNKQHLLHASPRSHCSRESRESVASTCTLLAGKSSNSTSATSYAASFVIQHPIEVDSNLYRV